MNNDGECIKIAMVNNNKLNVLFVTRKWPPAIGGMETYSFELTKELKKSCNLITRILPGRKNGSPPSIFSLLNFIITSMLAVMFSKRTDIIHIGDLVLWPLAVVAHIFRPSARLIITAYGLDIVYGTRKGLLPKIYNMYLALGVKLCSDYLRVIAISQATANLCRAVGFQDIVVVTLGVFTPVVTEVEVYKAENYVLFVGRLVKRKGAGWFIQNVLPFLDSKITLKIAGKPWDESEWDIISNNPRVEYLGVISNEGLRRYRQKAIAVLMPNIPTGGTDIEGFGLTALEAVADGGILLASGIEGIVDAVVDRETGFLLPAENVEAWKKNIEMISKWPEDERSLFIHQAQEILRNYFSWERVAQNTLVAYCNNYMKDARAG